MKTIVTGLIMLSFSCLYGQVGVAVLSENESSDGKQVTFTFPVKGNAGETWLVIENLFSDLEIQGTNDSEIKIVGKNYRGVPEKAKGLQPLSASGPENTGIGLSIKQEGNTISLSGAHREADKADYTLYLPKNLKMKLDYIGWQVGDVLIKEMAGEIEAKSQVGDLEFVDVTGPIVANTLSSDIDVTFTSLSDASPTSLSSTSGDIDVTFPESVKGTFKMATISGGIYTAFEFDFGEETNIKRIGGQRAVGDLNGGGVEVTLKSVSGDIYIRKPE